MLQSIAPTPVGGEWIRAEKKRQFVLLKHSDITQRIIQVLYEVYNELGYGFLESVYRRAMLIALQQAGLHAEDESPIGVWFRGQVVGSFSADTGGAK